MKNNLLNGIRDGMILGVITTLVISGVGWVFFKDVEAANSDTYWKSPGWKKDKVGAFKIVFHHTQPGDVEVHIVRQEEHGENFYSIQYELIRTDDLRIAEVVAEYWISEKYPFVLQTE